MAEQALLEQLLEDTKPAVPQAAEGLHYLLKTPFRYPPLKWGSRFGGIHRPGIFYGGCTVEVCLAESAFYRLLFWQSILAPPVKPVLRSAHTLVSVGYHSRRGVCLQRAPFSQYQADLTRKTSYQHTQQLGCAMRAAGVKLFEYRYARSEPVANCVGLFSATAFTASQPEQSSQWLCELSARQVSFKQNGDTQVYQFNASQFMVDGQLPIPA